MKTNATVTRLHDAIALLGLTVSACGGQAAVRPQAAEPPGRPVRTAVVERRVGEASMAPALLQARQRASLTSRIAAAVVELPYREGERAAAGAVLVRLDDGALSSSLMAAEAAAAAAEADRRRVERLLQSNAATAREAEEARSRAAAGRAAMEAAREGLSYAVLRAPFTGVVSARPVHVGDVVTPGSPLVVFEGAGGWELVATLDHAQAAAVRVGHVLRAEVDGVPGPVTVVVRAVSPAGDPTTHRFELRADVTPAPGLRSGLFARLALPVRTDDERLFVPRSAVLTRGGLTGLYVVDEGRARLRWVALGRSTETAIELRAGADAGERVVLDPDGLTEGAPVVER